MQIGTEKFMQRQYGKTALYCRFSKDDGFEQDSDSIVHQKMLLERYAFENGYYDYTVFTDDGYSGVDFNRPAFIQMLQEIESGNIVRVIVKDMSRFGRNVTLVGQYIDYVFPKYNVQLISVNDHIDTFKKDGHEDMLYFRNWFNEMYAKDISAKARAAIKAKGREGRRTTTHSIYGYRKDPNDKNNWLIDDEAAAVVRRIFELFDSGNGVTQIARILHDEHIKTPTAYSGKIRAGGYAESDPYLWSETTITSILSKQEYCGDTVNFRTERRSFKDKHIIYHDESEILIFQDTQPAIISRDMFERTKTKLNRKQKIKRERKPPFFEHILFCADCKSRMYIQRRKSKYGNADAYQCSGCRKRFTNCTTHYVKESYLIAEVLQQVQKVIHQNQADTKLFRKRLRAAAKSKFDERTTNAKIRMNEIQNQLDRIKALRVTAFEQKVGQLIDDVTFRELMQGFDLQNADLEREYTELERLDSDYLSYLRSVDGFVNYIARYTQAVTELDRDMMHSLIERIEIHERDSKGHIQADVYFRYIGLLE